jgi:hypothetical protein
MKALTTIRLSTLIIVLSFLAATLTTACSSSGSGMSRTHVSYGAGYRGYYRRPYGYPPVYVGGGVDPDWGVDQPVATPLPEMGMPDFGGGGMDMDMGGFDW